MRHFIKPLGVISLAVLLSGGALAQPPEEPDEIVVRAKPLVKYRAEIEVARDEMIRIFNDVNEGEDNDVRCRYEAPTGSHIPQRVCFSTSQDRASATAARNFLTALTFANGTAAQGSVTGIAGAQNEAAAGGRAMVAFDKEWQRVLATNQAFSDAVMKYRELEQEFDEARGAVIRVPAAVFAMKGPQCEASTYTEYKQLGNVARVTGKVSLSACPGGTTGKFAVVARVRDKTGTVTPIEFMEMWQTENTEDYLFFADYPLGDDVFLENLRVRNLKCTCADASP